MKRADHDSTLVGKRQCPSGLPSDMSLEQPSDHKTKKYDRQLRLWGDHGQAALEKAKVCLVGATATGTEILKNLVLPGLGSFCIVDHETVKGGDLGNNFFVTAQDIGRSRAEAATRLLLEMNSDVGGEYYSESLESILVNRPNFFHHFTVVIAADHPSEKAVQELGKLLWPVGIPLVICSAYGLVGYIRLIFHEHLVTEAKPDNSIQDLRLESPFPELVALKNEYDFDTMAKKAHSHVPYVIVLLAFLEKWMTLHGALPISYKDKVKFREFVDEGRLKNDDGVPFPEENFEEACKAVVKTIAVSKIPEEVQRLFSDPAGLNLTIFSPKFWILVRAIHKFTLNEGAGHLPLSGALPDMFSDTDSFVRLQNVYKAKADADAEVVRRLVHEICRDLGLSEDFITIPEIKYYCRNAAFLRCIRTSSLDDELDPENSKVGPGLTGYAHDDPQFRCSLWYIFLRVIREFYTQTGRFPDSEAPTVEEDVSNMTGLARLFLKNSGVAAEFHDLVTDELLEKYAREVARFGGQQVHSVAAFIGGTVGQEVIKLITGQYVPLNSTLIYDAAACTSLTFSF